jgi:hypothetical protein
MSRYVWMFLVKVKALQGGEVLTAGSEALLQVCIPGKQLESSLEHLHRYLASERYSRMDLSTARRYDLENDNEEFPADYLERDLRHAGRTDTPGTACVFTSKDSATFLLGLDETKGSG